MKNRLTLGGGAPKKRKAPQLEMALVPKFNFVNGTWERGIDVFEKTATVTTAEYPEGHTIFCICPLVGCSLPRELHVCVWTDEQILWHFGPEGVPHPHWRFPPDSTVEQIEALLAPYEINESSPLS